MWRPLKPLGQPCSRMSVSAVKHYNAKGYKICLKCFLGADVHNVIVEKAH